MLSLLLNLPTPFKRLVTLVFDLFGIICAYYVAMALRLGTFSLELGAREVWALVITSSLTIGIFVRIGLYREIMRYMTFPALVRVCLAVCTSALILATSSFFLGSFTPRTVPLIYMLLALVILGSPRVAARGLFYHHIRRSKPNVIIYGAGSVGFELASALLSGKEYHPVAFIDDDPAKLGTKVFSLRVHARAQIGQLISRYDPEKILLAIGNITHADRYNLLESLKELPVEVQSIPSMEELTSGRASISEVKDLDIEDLLGRDSVPPIPELLRTNITDKSVMVTGAGGSIGSELCRQIILQKPRTLVLFELNEYNLYRIEKELLATSKHLDIKAEIVPALGSVQRQNRLEGIMRNFDVKTLYHAAAYKHVPLVEHNVIEGVRNNVFGTYYVAEAAIASGVDRFVLISTDKAVRPTNYMGASKRMAELILQALAKRQSNTHFSIVRFGNVLDSSGSVVPLFREQIRNGGPVTVTHPDITRYFMTIPEAAQLVIQAGALSSNGKTFLLNMGDPIKILELARSMIKLSGLSIRSDENPFGDIEIKFTGLRPGEKLYEELLIGDNATGTLHPKIMQAQEESIEWSEMEVLINKLDEACHVFDVGTIHELLITNSTGFNPTGPIQDVLWDPSRKDQRGSLNSRKEEQSSIVRIGG